MAPLASCSRLNRTPALARVTEGPGWASGSRSTSREPPKVLSASLGLDLAGVARPWRAGRPRKHAVATAPAGYQPAVIDSVDRAGCGRSGCFCDTADQIASLAACSSRSHPRARSRPSDRRFESIAASCQHMPQSRLPSSSCGFFCTACGHSAVLSARPERRPLYFGEAVTAVALPGLLSGTQPNAAAATSCGPWTRCTSLAFVTSRNRTADFPSVPGTDSWPTNSRPGW